MEEERLKPASWVSQTRKKHGGTRSASWIESYPRFLGRRYAMPSAPGCPDPTGGHLAELC